MKITDIITESKKIDEAPVGMLKRAGMGIAAKLGSHTAQGGLETAKLANNLKNAYSKYLGKSRQKPNSENILAFLKSNGLPTDAAEQEIKQAAASAGVQLKPAQDMKKSLGIGKNAGQSMATPNKQEPSGTINTTAGAADNEPTMGTDYDTPAYQRKGVPEPKFMSSQQVLKSKLKGGKGLGKSTGGGFGSAVKAAKAKGLNMSQEHTGNPVMEVDLKGSTIDKIILAAVADAEKLNMGQELAAAAAGTGTGTGSAPGAATAASTGDDQTSGTGFFAGMKRGITGAAKGAASQQVKGRLNVDQLAKLIPNVDPVKLKRAVQLSLGGQELSRELQGVMAQTFGELIKLDPQTTTRAMGLLKAVQTN